MSEVVSELVQCVCGEVFYKYYFEEFDGLKEVFIFEVISDLSFSRNNYVGFSFFKKRKRGRFKGLKNKSIIFVEGIFDNVSFQYEERSLIV